ncbi:MAG: HDOD domain-containing protein [Desulfovibrio sp.]|nr:MAG: HDOD domain-containing protein [Desulfovibrio sp.]
MTNTPVPDPDSAKPSAPEGSELNAKAREITDKVMRFADPEFPPIAVLRDMGVQQREAQLADNDPGARMEEKFYAAVAMGSAPLKAKYMVIDPDSLVAPDMVLPSLPQDFHELQRVIHDESRSANDLAKVIAKSPALATVLLRLVNSAFYSLASKVDTISRAVAVVGTRQLTYLALGTTVMNVFQHIPQELVDLNSFWKHSIAVGVTSRLLAEASGLGNGERYFTAGLLHDIGRLMLLNFLPKAAKSAFYLARRNRILLHYAELDVVNYDHASLGCVAMRRWNLPESLTQAALFHHAPEIHNNIAEAAVIHVADSACRALNWGVSGEFFMPPIKHQAWDSLKLSAQDLREVLIKAEEQTQPLFTLLTQTPRAELPSRS